MKLKKTAFSSAAVFVLITIMVLAGFNTSAAEEAPKVVKVTFDDVTPYDAPGHFKMSANSFIGGRAGNAENLQIGLSIFEPGGGAEQSTRPVEMIYFVLEGTLTITTPDGEITLNQHDAIYRPVGSMAGIINNSGAPVKMLVIAPVAAAPAGAPPAHK